MKKLKLHIILLLVSISFFSCQTDWNENYNPKSKAPFGLYIFHQEINALFNEAEVENERQFFDEFHQKAKKHHAQNTYLSIGSRNYNFDEESFDALLEFVEEGNNLFIAYNEFDSALCELLGIETINMDSTLSLFRSNLKNLTGTLKIRGETDAYEYDRNLRFHYIDQYNASTTEVLGTIEKDGMSYPSFVRIKYNKGNIYIHTQPNAFTNYFLLKEKNVQYVERVFSHVGFSHAVYWDSSPKYKRDRNNNKKESALSFFMKHRALRWSLFTAFFGLIAFMLIHMRRKQRPIPVKKPLKNTTVEFTRTMANLYKEENNPKILIDKKISFFLHDIRHLYLLDTSTLDQEFIDKLSAKSGNPIKETSILIKAISRLQGLESCNEDELIRLNKLIENFFEQK